ncbi:MAG: acyl-CoA dehydrogenase family protein [Alphaproteobacteria bacterium]
MLRAVADIALTVTAGAAEADRIRRLPAPVLDALHGAGLFRLLLPRPFGGMELDPPAFARVIEALAGLDASTAWCVCQGNGCAMTAAYLEPAVADRIWGRDPRAVLAWGPGKATARPEGDGYRVSGRWSFASGGRHATWLGGVSTVLGSDGAVCRDATGSPIQRVMLFPAEVAPMTDVWDVIGLRGTGSDAYAVEDLPVGHAYSVSRDDPAERRYDAPLYLFPSMVLYASGFAATALGIARSMLDAYLGLAREKTPRLANSRLAEDSVIQSDYAQAEARHRSARAYLFGELEDIWTAVLVSGELTIAQRMRIRLAATFAIGEAKAAAEAVYDMAGASAVFASSPFERRYRDIRTVTQQLQGRKSHYATVGAYLFGLPPDLGAV